MALCEGWTVVSQHKPQDHMFRVLFAKVGPVLSSSRRGKEEEHLRHSLQRTEQKLATQLATEERFLWQPEPWKKRAPGLFGVLYSPVVWGL